MVFIKALKGLLATKLQRKKKTKNKQKQPTKQKNKKNQPNKQKQIRDVKSMPLFERIPYFSRVNVFWQSATIQQAMEPIYQMQGAPQSVLPMDFEHSKAEWSLCFPLHGHHTKKQTSV